MKGETMEGELLLKKEVYSVVGAAFEVMKEMGGGFLEHVYQESMELELGLRSVPFEPQAKIVVRYKGVPLKQYYVADLVCYGRLLVELKTMDRLSSREVAQVLNYLKATGFEVAILINFKDDGIVEWKRIVRTDRLVDDSD
jgi:GxxExxY protein